MTNRVVVYIFLYFLQRWVIVYRQFIIVFRPDLFICAGKFLEITGKIRCIFLDNLKKRNFTRFKDNMQVIRHDHKPKYLVIQGMFVVGDYI